MNRVILNKPLLLLDLSIIIISWNTRSLLEKCLRSILAEMREFPYLNIETLVVDNASYDGSVQMVQEQFSWVYLIANEENIGFATGNNLAIQQCRGRYILLLNPDTEVKVGALASLIHFMDEHPEAGAAGSRLLNPDHTLQVSCYLEPSLTREVWRLFHLDTIYPYALYRMATWSANLPRLVDIVQGASLIVRRAVLDQVGFLDTEYFMYSEEVDLCHRIRKSGWQIYWVPMSVVIHYGGQSSKQVADEMFLQLYKSKLLYFRKNHGWFSAIIYKAVLLAATITRLTISTFIWLESPSQRQEHWVIARHYRRLLRLLPTI